MIDSSVRKGRIDLDKESDALVTCRRVGGDQPQCKKTRTNRTLSKAYLLIDVARPGSSSETGSSQTATRAADELVKDGLDKLMLQFRVDDFCNEYKSVRRIASPDALTQAFEPASTPIT